MLAPRCLASSTSCLQAEKLASLSGVAVTWQTAASGRSEPDMLRREEVVFQLQAEENFQVNHHHSWSLTTALTTLLYSYWLQLTVAFKDR